MAHRIIHVSAEKQAYEDRLNELLDKYRRVLFVTLDHVQSQQVHEVREDLRGKGVLLMGKKTMQKKILMKRAESSKASENDKIFAQRTDELGLMTQNTGMLFTNEEPSVIIDILEHHRVQAPARVGTIAPVDVIVPAGNTGMEPTQTSFFQAVNIATKITKGTVEIISDKKVVSAGERVDNSVAALLQKLKITPFFYQIAVVALWDNGMIFDTEDLKITDAVVEQALIDGIASISTMSLGAGIPTAASLPIVAGDCFRKLLAASVATNYTFSEFGAEQMIKDAREGKLAAAAPAAAAPAKAAAAPAKAAEKEPEEEEEEFGLGGLF